MNDLDPNNPVDLTAEQWLDLYAESSDPVDLMDHDHSMDY